MKKNSFLLRLLLDWALICIGVLGSVYCMTTVGDFGILMPAAVPVLVPILALLFCLLFRGKTGKYYALGVLGLLLLLGWLFREDLIEGLRSLWATLEESYVRGYDMLKVLQPKEPPKPEAVGVGLATLAVLETFLCSLSVRLWKRTTPAALSLLPGVAVCFVLTDTAPTLPSLLAVVFSLLTQAFSQSARRRQTDEHPKAVALAALLSAVLLGLLLLFLPDQKDFKSPITWNDLTEKLDRWGEEQNNRGNTTAGFSGNPEEVDLTALGSLPNRPVPMLYVTSAQSAYLYLRGSSYMDFDGSRWTRGAQWEGDWKAPFSYLKRTDGVNLVVETRNREAVLYTTYQLSALPGYGTLVGDSYVENSDGVDHYSLRFLVDPDPVEYDGSYDAWVKENCLNVPEKTRAAVLAWWEAHGTEAGTPSAFRWDDSLSSPIFVVQRDETEFARQVAAKISETARYSRDPARVPAEAEDFCGWFLNEAEEGYCVHYASACTALLRSLGIPARYVSGYVCEAKGGERTRVTNLQAHAWTEIWVGGRWVVIEATPDYATEFTGIVNPFGNETETNTETAAATTEFETVPAPPATKPMPTENEELPETKPTQNTDPTGRGSTSGKDDPEPKDRRALWVFLGVVGFVLLTVARRELTLRFREHRLVRAKGNAKALLLYRHIRRLHRLGGGPIPPEATQLAQKAAFSHHELDDTELYYLRQVYEQKRCRLGISGFWKRLWCKYVLAVI